MQSEPDSCPEGECHGSTQAPADDKDQSGDLRGGALGLAEMDNIDLDMLSFFAIKDIGV